MGGVVAGIVGAGDIQRGAITNYQLDIYLLVDAVAHAGVNVGASAGVGCQLLEILIQCATVDTGMFTSVHVSDDSAFCAPSAASAALLVKVFRVNSMALLVVVVLGSNASMLNGWNAPATMPAFRCGATVVSEPVRVFFTSTRNLFRLPQQNPAITSRFDELIAPGYRQPAFVPAFAWILLDLQNAVSQFALLDREAVNRLLWYRQMAGGVFGSAVLSANLTAVALRWPHEDFITAAISLMLCSINAKSPHGGVLCFDKGWVTAGFALAFAAALPAVPALLSRRLASAQAPLDKYQFGAADQRFGQPFTEAACIPQEALKISFMVSSSPIDSSSSALLTLPRSMRAALSAGNTTDRDNLNQA